MHHDQPQTNELSVQEQERLDANKLWADDFSEVFQPDKSNLVKRYSVPSFNRPVAADSEAIA